MLFAAITGINTVIFYSTTIFELAGVQQEVNSSWMDLHLVELFFSVCFGFRVKQACE